jgi:hypothetical protein
MPRLVALKEHKYDSIIRHPGEEYDATDKHAFILKRLERAKDAPVARRALAPMPAPVAVPRAMAVASEPDMEAPASVQPTRRYRRRDMAAQD